MTLRLTVVDSFTDRPFRGNPAAVSVVDAFPSDERMQDIAREMNLSETSFVAPRAGGDGGGGGGDHDLRWFTPTVEVDLCGHATLAAAHVLGGSARFHTRSGVLVCSLRPDGSGVIEMDFPSDPLAEEPMPGGLFDAVIKWCGRARNDLLVELSDADSVRGLKPDIGRVASLPGRGLIVTAAGDSDGVDCISRFFAPNLGIPEDPVTGSAHCTLAGYWSERLDKTSLVGVQASPRGGTVYMRVDGDRVVLGGQAVTVSEVHLLA